MSQNGREALDQGFNPRSLSDEDYAIYVKATGTDAAGFPVEPEPAAEGEDDA
jgi:hypothetical protein